MGLSSKALSFINYECSLRHYTCKGESAKDIYFYNCCVNLHLTKIKLKCFRDHSVGINWTFSIRTIYQYKKQNKQTNKQKGTNAVKAQLGTGFCKQLAQYCIQLSFRQDTNDILGNMNCLCFARQNNCSLASLPRRDSSST